jgi:SAM-dependent methyltransferase
MSRFESAGAEYWNGRYRTASFPYGEEPSRSCERAIEVFRERGVRSVVVAGCGSGRHVLAFARSGFDVVGFDVSPVAVAIARDALERERLRGEVGVRDLLAGSLPPHDPWDRLFDAAFAYGIVPLFSSAERPRVARALLTLVRAGGIAVVTVFSRSDPKFADGEEVEPGSFRDSRGRTAHFFGEEEARALCAADSCRTIRLESIEEPPRSAAAPPHRLYWVLVERTPNGSPRSR